jgi:PEP-CTERM motif
MKKLNPSLLLAVALSLCANSALAQGTRLFTWHNAQGPNNTFFASFQIYDYELTPETYFSGSHLYEQTLVVTSPDHTWYGGGGYASRFIGSDLYLDLICRDPAFPGVEVDLYGNGGIAETTTAGIRFRENGFWTYAPVPEPSSAAFLTLGLLALYSRKATNRT